MNTHTQIKYVFCINSGRSGSQYLYKLFLETHNCIAFHEKKPIGNGIAMRDYLNGKIAPIANIAKQKSEYKKKETASGKIYIETNHCFIKGFGWLLPQFIKEENMAVIILSRNKEEIVNSLLRVSASLLEKDGRNWLISPDIKFPNVMPPGKFLTPKLKYYLLFILKLPFRKYKFYNLINISPLKTPSFIKNYEADILRWYLAEIDSLTEKYREIFKKIKFIEVHLTDLNKTENVKSLFDELGLVPKESLNKIIGVPANVRADLQNK